jgi:hypothetical protein
MDSQIESSETSPSSELPHIENELNSQSTLEIPSRTIEDTEGFERKIHTFKSIHGKAVDVVFYSQGELPFTADALNHKNGFIFGEKPHWRSEDEWNTYISELKSASEKKASPILTDRQEFRDSIVEESAVIFVQTGLDHLLDMAFTLGADSPKLRELRQKAAQHDLSEEANEIIDGIIAVNLFDSEGKKKQTLDYEGELLTLRALMGDNQAHDEIIQRKIYMIEEEDEYTQTLIRDRLLLDSQESTEPLKLTDLVGVHLTKFPPKDVNRHLEIQSVFDATDWKDPRQTVHFSLNHPVQSHSDGSWNESSFAVIAPMEGLVLENGKPAALNSVDTFFEVSPGSRIKLPEESWLVKPGGVPEGSLFHTAEGERNVVNVKSQDLTPQDIEKLMAQIPDWDKVILKYEISNVITNPNLYGFEEFGLNAMDGFNEDTILSPEEYEKLRFSLAGEKATFGESREIDAVSLLTQKSFNEVIGIVSQHTGIDEEKISPLLKTVHKNIQSMFKNQILKIAINKTIQEMGYTVEQGGMHSWGESKSNEKLYGLERLATQMGIDTSKHAFTTSAFIEQKAYSGGVSDGSVEYRLEKGEISALERRKEWDTFLKSVDEIDKERLSRANKRLLYAMGVL